MTGGAIGDRIAVAWRTHHSYLVDLAFRMLGDVGAAEDVAQEAFVRLAKTGDGEVRDDRGWLTVVTSRLCLDQIRSAQARRERVEDVGVVDSAEPVAQVRPVDPADRVTLDDEVRLALFVVLQRLSPAERVAFVLHDVFQTPFDAVAQTLGKTTATCRQLALRARRKIADAPVQVNEVGRAEHRTVTETFIAACANGDLDALSGVLHPKVWGAADFGSARRRTNHGRDLVAKTLLRHYHRRGTVLVSHPVAGRPTVLAYYDRRLFAVMSLTVVDDLITQIEVDADPETLADLARWDRGR
ncbi:RNA polymerase sigma factor SigI [Actinokineospora iranica]|uniref:RNA polymerase sigma-70 factor, ECF subfamily n=1 Tax=Actinokineospora iranica TaxID=1271860 RepID=A0A1G6WIJ6_9PSEU|nr:RNA polymerase sigma factor SigI [Actinokineospora iranica]SDD65589.1 RNA polymerase sigma-70 factor, ECF subfamily [Actinokineospora iranica]